MSVLIAVYPCTTGDKLEIYQESEWSDASPVSYFLNTNRLYDLPRELSEYEARTIMHEEGFLFCEVELTDHVPTVASGELVIP